MRVGPCTAVLVCLVIAARASAGDVEEPPGYHFEPYRAPTPSRLTGATMLDTAAAEQLWREGSAVFVDVMPRDPKPPNLPAGTLWRDRPRSNIPGSTWLANVGYGALS